GSKDFSPPQCAVRIEPVTDDHPAPANTAHVASVPDEVPSTPVDVKQCAIRHYVSVAQLKQTLANYRDWDAHPEHSSAETKAVLAAFHVTAGQVADSIEKNFDRIARSNTDFTL